MDATKDTSKDTNDHSSKNRLTIALFTVYLAALCWILLFKLGVQFSYMGNRSINLIPFRTVLIGNGEIDVPEIILNVLIFVPLGVYAGMLYSGWTFIRKIFSFFLVSLIIEGLQFILGAGAFDTTDLITNTLGGLVGLMIFTAIQKAFNNRYKTRKFIHLIAVIGTALMIVLLFLLKMNMLPIRYQ
jgi:glycopeptide antibiotics resistance protein